MNKLFFVAIFLFLFVFVSDEYTYGYYTNMPASVVVGQGDFGSSTAGTSNSLLRAVEDVIVVNGKLIVSENNNNRVLIWNTIPTTDGKAADVVLGQPDFNSNTANNGGVSARTLSVPTGLASDGTRLFVADRQNRRVLIWNSIPTTNFAPADVVVGQQNFTSNSTNQGGTAGANTLNRVQGVHTDGTRLFIADTTNNRVLIFNSIPTTNNASADLVLGQSSFSGVTANAGGIGASALSTPEGVFYDGYNFLVADSGNNRLLIWKGLPTQNNESADVVVGQLDFTGVSEATTNNLIAGVSHPRIFGGRLFLDDTTNNRVLIFNTVPDSNGAAADIVIGQPNLTSGSINQGGSISGSGFSASHGVFVYDGKLLVGDANNNRLLIFNNVLSSPHLSVSNVEEISGGNGKLKINGGVEIGERGRYSLSSVVASVNGLGYGNVTSKDNGRDNGDGKTLYEFTHEFEPWVNNNGDKNTWKDKGYTVALKAISSNAEEDEVLLFSPFTLKAMNKDSSSLEFSVPSVHWSTLVDKLSYYTVEVKRKTDKEWSTLTTISPSHSNNTTVSGSTTNPTYTSTLPSSSLTPLSKSLKINTVVSSYTPSTGEIKVKVDTTLPSGEYRVQAVSKTGSTFSSNTVSYTSGTTSYLPSLTLTTSWFPLQINKITGTNLSILSSFSTYTPKPLTSSTTTPTVSGIAPSYSTVYLQVTNSNSPTQKRLYKTTTTSSTSFSLPITLYTNSTIDTWVTNQHNTTVLSPIALTANTNNSVLKQYLPKSMDKTNGVLY